MGADVFQAIGSATWLMSMSRAHRFLFVPDLAWAVVPPARYRQCKIWYRDGQPTAYATWAKVSDSVDERVRETKDPRLKSKEWCSGSNTWLMDAVAPMGDGDSRITELCGSLLSGQRIRSLQSSPKGMVVVEW